MAHGNKQGSGRGPASQEGWLEYVKKEALSLGVRGTLKFMAKTVVVVLVALFMLALGVTPGADLAGRTFDDVGDGDAFTDIVEFFRGQEQDQSSLRAAPTADSTTSTPPSSKPQDSDGERRPRAPRGGEGSAPEEKRPARRRVEKAGEGMGTEASFRQQYVRSSVLERLPNERPVLLVLSRRSRLADDVASKLAQFGHETSKGILKPAAYRDGVYEKVKRGNERTLRRLGLSKHAGKLIALDLEAGDESGPKTNPYTDDVTYTRKADLEATVVPFGGGAPYDEATFIVRGSGKSSQAAQNNVEPEAAKKLAVALRNGTLQI